MTRRLLPRPVSLVRDGLVALLLMTLANICSAQPACSNTSPKTLAYNSIWQVNSSTCRYVQLTQPQSGRWNVFAVTATHPGWDIAAGGTVSAAASNLCDFVVFDGRTQGNPASMSGQVWTSGTNNSGSVWVKHGRVDTLPLNATTSSYTFGPNSVARIFEVFIPTPGVYTVDLVNLNTAGSTRWRFFAPSGAPVWRHRSDTLGNGPNGAGPVPLTLCTPGWYGLVVYANGTVPANSGQFRAIVAPVTPAPTISAISPNQISIASPTPITITGSNFDLCYTSVSVDGTGVPFSVGPSGGSLAFSLPPSALGSVGTKTVSVSNPGHPPVLTTVQVVNPPVASLSATASPGLSCNPNTLQVNGSGITSSSQANWNGNAISLVPSGGGWSASLPAALIPQGGSYTLTVSNPPPGGGSASTTVTIQNPTPSLASLSSSTAFVGSPSFGLTMTGSCFMPGCLVHWSASGATTSLNPANVSTSQLQVVIPSSLLATVGTASLTVSNPLQAGAGQSNALSFTVRHPLPSITSATPSSPLVVGTAAVLSIQGTGFHGSSTLLFNGAPIPFTFISSTALSAAITPSQPGLASIQVQNPTTAGGGGISNTATLPVSNPTAVLASISPPQVPAGSAAINLTLSGSGFVPGAVVHWGSLIVTPSSLSPTQISFGVTASQLVGCGTIPVTVANPLAPPSNAASFAVRCPSITSLNPQWIAPGSLSPLNPAVILLQGNDFLTPAQGGGTGATVYANGFPLGTATIQSPNLITATLDSSFPHFESPGAVTLTVQNTPLAVSNTVAVGIDNWANVGTIVTDPLDLSGATSAALRLEGCPPGQSFILVGALLPQSIAAPWPTFAINLVNGALTANPIVLIDGPGIFGPGDGSVFSFDPAGTAPGGTFSTGFVPLNQPPTGVQIRVQAFYFDPTTPHGFGATWPQVITL